MTVVGEPGIGKTRLARELALREEAETTVLVARCIAHGEGVTFLPLLGALRRAEPEQALAEEQDAELVLARLAALAEGAETAPLGESYWAVRRLLESLARRQPVLLVLDDVHWAEPALVDLIDYLADRADAPMLIACLARPELERPLGELLELGPLGEDEARAIVAGTAELRRGDERSDRRPRRGQCALRRAARVVRGRRRRGPAADAGGRARRAARAARCLRAPRAATGGGDRARVLARRGRGAERR